MGLKDDIASEVRAILDWSFNVVEEKTKVPRKEDLTLGKTAIELNTCVLYVDMRGSSTLADIHRRRTAAKVYNAYLNAMVRVARKNEGEVRSFNGDSILVFFSPAAPNLCDVAVRTAKEMQWVAKEILEPTIKAKGYEDRFRIGVSIARGPLLVTMAGLRGDPYNSDLIWPCTCVNLAAKLVDRARDNWPIYISREVYEGLSPEQQFAYPKAWLFREPRWDQCWFDFAGKSIPVYRTNQITKVE